MLSNFTVALFYRYFVIAFEHISADIDSRNEHILADILPFSYLAI